MYIFLSSLPICWCVSLLFPLVCIDRFLVTGVRACVSIYIHMHEDIESVKIYEFITYSCKKLFHNLFNVNFLNYFSNVIILIKFIFFISAFYSEANFILMKGNFWKYGERARVRFDSYEESPDISRKRERMRGVQNTFFFNHGVWQI